MQCEMRDVCNEKKCFLYDVIDGVKGRNSFFADVGCDFGDGLRDRYLLKPSKNMQSRKDKKR